MTSRPIPAAAGLAARAAVGAVLVYAGAGKAAGPAEEFAIVIASYDILPREMILTAATFLPWIELLAGWSLLLGLRVRASAAAAGSLFAAFLLALASVQLKGIPIPNCGCFAGDSLHFTPMQAVLFDSTMLALCWLAWKAPTRWSLDSWTEGGYTGHRDGKR